MANWWLLAIGVAVLVGMAPAYWKLLRQWRVAAQEAWMLRSMEWSYPQKEDADGSRGVWADGACPLCEYPQHGGKHWESCEYAELRRLGQRAERWI